MANPKSHTPEDWTVVGNRISAYGRGTIAVVPSIEDGGVMEFLNNSRLIAAAPDLLTVAVAALELIEGDLTGAEWKRACHEFAHTARAAISRATSSNANA